MLVYAMADIHGEKEAFEDALSVVDFSDGNILVLCGDYIDHSHDRPEFLAYILEFQESHAGQVVVLKGNHEQWYLEELGVEDGAFHAADPGAASATIKWVRNLPLFYETDTQIFVHAGLDEEARELWRVGTEDYFFLEKFPQTYGSFPKDIIAGHVGTWSMCGENRVFWDGESHFYLDGTTEESKIIPVLKYDTETGRYTSFEKVDACMRWSEYVVRPGSGEESESGNY